MDTTYKRLIYKTIFQRLKEPRRFIQLLTVPFLHVFELETQDPKPEALYSPGA